MPRGAGYRPCFLLVCTCPVERDVPLRCCGHIARLQNFYTLGGYLAI